MCFPGAVGAVVGIAQSVVSFGAAQSDYNARAAQWTQNYKNALASGRDEQRQITLRMTQEEEAFKQKSHQNSIEGAQVAAEAEVSAASAGIAGISLDNILVGIGRKTAEKQTADATNYRNTVQQLTTKMAATNTTIENRINSVQRPTAPNPLGYALTGLGGAFKSISSATA
jgi:GTP-dependent phosphoenolpyruvate carboxykinase